MGDVYMVNGKILSGLPNHAKDIEFDNTGTDLISTNSEDAIKEVNSNLTDKVDIADGTLAFFSIGESLQSWGSYHAYFHVPLGEKNVTLVNASYQDNSGSHTISGTPTVAKQNDYQFSLSHTDSNAAGKSIVVNVTIA